MQRQVKKNSEDSGRPERSGVFKECNVIERHAKHLAIWLTAGLAGCVSLPSQQMAVDEEPVVVGAAARRNYTPLEPAFACMANGIRQKNQPAIGIAVGDVKDYTGKYSQNEGSTITQGGALMIYSALGKMGNVVQIQERFDTRIAELELAYTDRRQLGDGRSHAVEPGKPAVPWVPYFGGSILRSQYYIVGGVTELNYNIQSGGVEAAVNNIGAKRRTFTMNVGVDLRMIDTRTLVVVKTVSMQKQIRGQEVGAGVYRFFGSDLLDLNVGSKNQEPLQLGVRTTIEQGVLELMAAVTGVDAGYCINRALESRNGTQEAKPLTPEDKLLMAIYGEAPPGSESVVPPANGAKTNGKGAPVVDQQATQSGMVPQNAVSAGQGGAYQVQFDFASSGISTPAMSQIEKMATEAGQGKTLTFQMLGRDSEVFPPMQRRELTNQRIKAVTDALVARGVQASRIGVTWLPEPTDSSITRQGAGYQLLATLVIAK